MYLLYLHAIFIFNILCIFLNIEVSVIERYYLLISIIWYSFPASIEFHSTTVSQAISIICSIFRHQVSLALHDVHWHPIFRFQRAFRVNFADARSVVERSSWRWRQLSEHKEHRRQIFGFEIGSERL